MQLKDLLSPAFVDEAAAYLGAVVPDFESARFTRLVLNDHWSQLELKQRFRHVAVVAHELLPQDFTVASALLAQVAHRVREERWPDINFGYMFLCDYIEQYGLDHYEASVRAIEEITRLMSAEFAVRPFLLRYPEPMMAQMLAWSRHEHAHVRRLSSEGCRPRLPWGMGVPFLKKDPSPILPILENLKEDPEEFVRRSVANNLNDISKDHPELTLDIFRRWKGLNPEADWIVKHASRTLLKQGHPQAVALFGYSDHEGLRVEGLELVNPTLQLGADLHFRFKLVNESGHPELVRLEYAVYFRRGNGAFSRKVFKISEREYPPQSITLVERRQHFRPITTRRYYSGEHRLAIVLNGVEQDAVGFEVIE